MKTNEYLAMLYVQSRDLSNAEPGELLVLYKSALERINNKENELYELNRKSATRQFGAQGGDGLSAYH